MIRRALALAPIPLLFSMMAPLLAQSSQESIVPLPGVRLRVRDTGGSGIPVVLLHVNTGTTDVWEPQFPAFSSAGYRVIAFDRRGWGRSIPDPASGPQPGTVADDLDALATHLRLPPFHLVGTAGGGFVALDYAVAFPHRLLSLVVAASSGGIEEEKEMDDLRDRLRFAGFTSTPTEFRELGVSYRSAQPEGVRRWVEIERSARQPGAASQPLKSTQTFGKLRNVATPTLILAGGADLLAPPAMMQLLVKQIPAARFAVIPDAGHAVA
jgi:pimeloyl-ACP methyl ester carboxylesterase